MLNFIYGRAGSGKTTKIIEMIKECVDKKQRAYLIVPEQQAFISESMLAFLDPSSALCFEVISFSRLCDIVFSKYGGVTEDTEGGVRSLIMWQTLRELKSSSNDANKKILKEYNNVKIDSSLSSMMLSTIDELRACGFSAEMCETAAQDCTDTRLSSKLCDIALIYERYNSRLENLSDGEEYASEIKLSRLLSLLEKHNDCFSDCHIFVDSFTSFTAEERKVLFALAKVAQDFTITFSRDKESKGMPHTVSIDDTFNKFLAFAEGNYNPIHCKAEDSPKDEALKELEKNLWNFSLTKSTVKKFSPDSLSHIEAYRCKNEFEEINLVALKMLEEHSRGIKFSEMAVVLRDAESRKGLIEAVFEKMGIPYFLSERTDISTTAASRLILSAIRCVVYNFRAVDVLTLLKTGLCGVSDEKSDLFEDYVYTWNISGSKFLLPEGEKWSMNPDGFSADKPKGRSLEILQAANQVRELIIPKLEKLRNEMQAAKHNPVELCRAIYNYLGEIKLQRSLSELAKRDLASADLRAAGENLRIYDSIISILGNIASVLKNESITSEEFLSALELMLRGSDVGSVPAVGEFVTIGSAPTLRVENIKIAFVLGLCEGEFPRSYSDSGIFTEVDKEMLKDILPLTSREKRISSDELYYVYRAMTKPSEKLVVSTCTSRIGGGSCTPSSAWNRLFFIFPELKAYDFDLSYIKKLAKATINGNISNIASEDQDLGDRSSETDDNIQIHPLQIEMLFGDKLVLSQSKITAFSGCPYKYWSQYVLDLRERKISQISYNNSGTLIHYVLENLIPSLAKSDGGQESDEKEKGYAIRIPGDDELVSLVNEYVDSYIQNIGCELESDLMYSFSRLRDLSLIMAKDVIREFADSSFKVLATEMNISRYTEDELASGKTLNDDELSPINITVEVNGKPKTVILNGKIDRLDVYDGDDRRYIRVVDYKTGNHTFDLDGVESGEDVQLPTYLFTAALDTNKEKIGGDKEIFPASALFHLAKGENGEPERSGFMLNDIDVLRAASSTLDKKVLAGIVVDEATGEVSKGNAVDEDDIKGLESTLHESISAAGRRILSGDARRTPSENACRYCNLKDSCPVAAKVKEF